MASTRSSREALAARRIGDVELDGDVRLEPLDSPRTADDAGALGREQARRRGADSARGARDDRGLAVEPAHAATGTRRVRPCVSRAGRAGR